MHFQVVEITLDVALASIRFLPIITLQCTTFIFSTILNYFYHFQPFLLFKKCAYLKEVIRRNFDQCGAREGGIKVVFRK